MAGAPIRAMPARLMAVNVHRAKVGRDELPESVPSRRSDLLSILEHPHHWRALVPRRGLLLACVCAGCQKPAIADVQAQVSVDVTTVVTVTWTTADALSCHVEYGPTVAYGCSTPPTLAGTEHEAVLLGLTAETEVHYRVVADGDGDLTDDQTVQTGRLPGGLPVIDVQGGGQEGFFVTPVLGSSTQALVLDAQGNIVWYAPVDEGAMAFRVLPSVDGRSFLYGGLGIGGLSPNGTIERISVDGSQREEIPVPYIHHDFVELPDGTIAAIAYDIREVGDGVVMGDQLVEVAPDGTSRQVWTAWDHFEVTDSGVTEKDGTWTHANALDYDPVSDTYTVSLRNLSCIVHIDRASGEQLWVLGGDDATIELSADSTSFEEQHQFELFDHGILLFDNGDSERGVSMVNEYTIDWQAGVADEIWSYTSDPPVWAYVLGDVFRYDNGDTLVDWASSGMMQRVTPDGEVTWQVNTHVGSVFGFVEPLPDLYVR